jgi:hypothetical protein
MILYQQSEKNAGLSAEDSAITGWKFVPTLMAVVYTQLTVMLLNAMKRTEPFARLARSKPDVPAARHTLLEKPRPWWTTLVHGFQSQKNGGVKSWAIILSCAVFILAALAISPISAALLGIKEIQVSNPVELARFELNRDSVLQPQVKRDTYLRTTGALLQNYSTSPWMNDKYFILPFWPVGKTGSSWNYRSSIPQTLEAETTVFHSNFSCSELTLKSKEVYLRHAYDDIEAEIFNQTYLASVLLESDDGCQYNLTYNATTEQKREKTLVSWSDINHIAEDITHDADARIILNDKCTYDEMIVMSSPWFEKREPARFVSNLTLVAYACSSTHTMAVLPVSAFSTPNGLSITFNEETFQQMAENITSTVIDLTKLHDIYTDPDWYSFIPQPAQFNSTATSMGGAAALLGTKHTWNFSRMVQDPDLTYTAARMRGRFFSEVLRTSMDVPGNSKESITTGRRQISERRIVTNREVAATLCILLVTSFAIFLTILFLSRLNRRPLNISHDPSTLLGIGSLVVSDVSVLSTFLGMDLSDRKTLKSEFSSRRYVTLPNVLREVDTGPLRDSDRKWTFAVTGSLLTPCSNDRLV